MEENKNTETPLVDYEDVCDYITKNTGIDSESVMKVLEAEANYLIKIGIIITE